MENSAVSVAEPPSGMTKRKVGGWNLSHPALDSFRSTVELEFDQLLREVMPHKLQELNEWLRSFPPVSSQGPHAFHQPQSPNHGSGQQGSFGSACAPIQPSPSNLPNAMAMPTDPEPLLRQWIDRLQNEIILFLSVIEKLKLGIELRVPRIEDGNNFGVSIQEDMIGELARVQESALHILDSSVKYYAGRAKLCSKILKYPGIQDYVASVSLLDVKQWTHLKMNALATRNGYAVLLDMISKNMERIISPRNLYSAANSMY